MSLGWLRCLVCVALIHTSFQNGGERPDEDFLATANFSPSVIPPYPNNCACHDRDGRIYNLEPLQNTDGTASLTVKSKKYPGYSYTYNPCSSFKLGPTDGGCQRDVAICWYVPKGLPDPYKTIANQRRAGCTLDRETKIPILVYHSSSREFRYRKATVKMKCDEKKKEKGEAIFEILDEDEWIFQVTHLCACGNGCLINPAEPTTTEDDVTTSPDPYDPMTVGRPIAVAVGSVGFVLVVIFIVWLVVRSRNRNNNINDERPPPGYGAVDQVQNPIGENPAGRSQPVPISSSHAKADVNVISERVLETS